MIILLAEVFCFLVVVIVTMFVRTSDISSMLHIMIIKLRKYTLRITQDLTLNSNYCFISVSSSCESYDRQSASTTVTTFTDTTILVLALH